MINKKIIKNKCEIATCQENNPEALHLHHIIERTEENTSNHLDNLALLCANCHAKVHAGKIKLIGIYPATILPNKRILVYEIDGKKNIDLDVPYLYFKNKTFKI